MSRVGSFGQISEINDHLFLSGAHVLKPEAIKKKNITCIVNATVEEPGAHFAGVDYLKIRIDDNPFARLDQYFDVVADKIKATKDRGGRTLVHCVAGVSRSASLCIAYLMKFENMSLRQAYQHVKLARPIIRPNQGFWKQLIEYEKHLFGANTVQMVPSRWGPDQPVPDVYAEEIRLAGGGPSSLMNGRSSSWSPNGISLSSTHSSSTVYYPRSSSSVHSSPSSNLSSRLANRYYRRSAPSASMSALSLANSVPLPLKSKLKANLFSSLYGQSTSVSDFLFPSF